MFNSVCSSKNNTHIKINKLKITQIIQSLSEVERRQLEQWLESPAHNKRPEVLLLFQALGESVHLLGLLPTPERLYERIYPQSAYDAQRLRQLCHYLLKATERWLSFEQEAADTQLRLLRTYRERQLGRLFEQTYRRMLTKLEQQAYRNPEYYFQRWELARERYAWDSARGRTAKLNLEEQEMFLQIATLGMKLRQACLSKAEQQISDQQIAIPMLAEVMKSSSAPAFSAVPVIQIYGLAIQLYEPEVTDDIFQQFTYTLNQHAAIFPKEEARDLLLLGINFSIKRINSGQQEYLRSCLTLFQRGLDNELLLEQGRLDALTYNNIAGIAIRLGELDWTIDFLDSYRLKLDARSRAAVYALNKARIAYMRKTYDEALRLLASIKDRDFIHQMSARILQLKIYLDIRELDLALNHIRNTRTYLKRQKNKGYHAQNYLHILRLAESWCKLPPYDLQGQQQWLEQVQSTRPLTERSWLLQLSKS